MIWKKKRTERRGGGKTKETEIYNTRSLVGMVPYLPLKKGLSKDVEYHILNY